jgi:nitrogen fixation protein FixH
MKNKNSGRLWPYAIAIAITMVFGFCVATVMVTSKADIQQSDAYMTNYQDADAKANDLIKARIAFDKKYKLKYVTETLTQNGCAVKYELTTLDGKPVKDAKMVLAISRPETEKYNEQIKNPVIKDNLYVFNDVKFPKTGAWNLLLKVNIGNDSRFFDIRTDTRVHHDRYLQEAATY